MAHERVLARFAADALGARCFGANVHAPIHALPAARSLRPDPRRGHRGAAHAPAAAGVRRHGRAGAHGEHRTADSSRLPVPSRQAPPQSSGVRSELGGAAVTQNVITALARVPVPPAATVASDGLCCAHCGLPVPADGATDDGGEARFCCTACAVAHSIIQGAGLGAYYERRSDGDGGPARPSGKSYAEYDDPAFAARHLTSAVAGGARLELFVSGIHCTACVWLLERLPRVQEGVRSARFDLGRSALEVIFDPASVRPSEIARALDRLG